MSRRFVTDFLSPNDAERWNHEAQDQLFRQVHDIHPGVCHRLMNMIPSMNGTSLCFLKMAVDVPWNEIIQNGYLKLSMLSSKETMVLYSKQEEFRRWLSNEANGAEKLKQLDQCWAEWK